MTSRKRHSETIRCAIGILSYLRDHPRAKDTAEGIARWWVDEKLDAVQKALVFLMAEGVMVKRGVFYQLEQVGPGMREREFIEEILQRLLSGQ